MTQTQERRRYTDEEHDKIYDLVDRLPTQFFGRDGDEEWEATVLELAKMVEAAQLRAEDLPDFEKS